MDLYCQKCNKPFDAYEVNHEFSLQEGKNFLGGKGCPCCAWGKKAPKDSERSEAQKMQSAAMFACAEVLGGDLDGMASMMDDFDYMLSADEPIGVE